MKKSLLKLLLKLLLLPYFLILFFAIQLPAQAMLDWFVLSDVTFEEEALEDTGLAYNKATFGASIQAFDGVEVALTGYIIPMDPMGITYVLSRNPNATCFFCGGAGPETVVQLNMAPGAIKRYNTDDRLTFKGILQLNKNDIESMTYVLQNAEELE